MNVHYNQAVTKLYVCLLFLCCPVKQCALKVYSIVPEMSRTVTVCVFVRVCACVRACEYALNMVCTDRITRFINTLIIIIIIKRG